MPLTPYQRRQMRTARRSGYTAAQEAAQAGDLDLVKDYLNEGYPAQALWDSALHWRRNNPAVLEHLLALGVPADRPLKDGQTALMVAAHGGDLPLAQRLHAAGARVNAVSTNGDSALAQAALGRHPTMVQWLLDQGADPNPSAQGEACWTALHWAVEYAFSQQGLARSVVPQVINQGRLIAGMLLEAGADPNAENPQGDTPFQVVLRSHSAHAPAMLETMLAAGADINRLSDGGSHSRPLGAVTGVYFQRERFEWLMAQRPDLDVGCSYGRLPLIHAMTGGSFVQDEDRAYCTQRLLEQGADPHLQIGKDDSPFVMFLRQRANARENDPFLNEGLWDAMVNSPRFRVDAPDPTGCRPLSSLLLDTGWNAHHTDLLQRLIRLGADVNAQNLGGQTPLVILCARNWAEHQASEGLRAMNLLLDAGADPRAGRAVDAFEASKDPGHSLLHLLAKGKKPQGMVQRLLDAGLSPNAQDALGNTPLHLAVRNEAVDTAQRLIAHGASCSVRNSDHELPHEVVSPYGARNGLAPLLGQMLAAHEQQELGALTLDGPTTAPGRGRSRL